ncbi:O-antigen ligase family protein [Aestuariivivens sp. NBU2969]|uniref:O-antigen ligase family protein n=1 Tax=Aestuariivivens sp. NBU2969 TaxID=2873267 RepID=UPI001CBC1C4D
MFHGVYSSIILLIAILFLIYLVEKSTKNIYRFLYVIILLVFSFIVFFLLNSKIGKIIFVVNLFVLLIYYIKKKSKYGGKLFFPIIILFCFSTYFFGRNMVHSIIKYSDNKYRTDQLINDVIESGEFIDKVRLYDETRFSIYSYFLNNYLKTPYFGLGLGDTKFQINGITYNTHNQFLHYLVVGGPLGLLFFIVYIIFIFRNLKNEHIIWSLTLITLLLVSLSENYINRYQGAQMMAFLQIFFLYKIRKNYG